MSEQVTEMKDYTKMEKLNQWISQLVYPGKSKEFIQELEGHSTPGVEVFRQFAFYTEEYQYIIVAIDRTEDNGYLGCQVQVRKPRPSEDWLRGNDLADGPFNKNTWNDIVESIVRYELVRLSKYLKPEAGDIEP